MRELNSIAVRVSDLALLVQKMKQDGMEFALLEISDEELVKSLYVRGVPSEDSDNDVDYGSIPFVWEVDRGL